MFAIPTPSTPYTLSKSTKPISFLFVSFKLSTKNVPFEFDTNSVPIVACGCRSTSTARECVVDSTIVYAFSRSWAEDWCGNWALAQVWASIETYRTISPLSLVMSFNATTAYFETIAKAITPLAFRPIPKSTTFLSFSKKSSLEKRREDERECMPSLAAASNATQKMRSCGASCLKSLLEWANWQREVSTRSFCAVVEKASLVKYVCKHG
jgi:hypothetical protein